MERLRSVPWTLRICSAKFPYSVIQQNWFSSFLHRNFWLFFLFPGFQEVLSFDETLLTDKFEKSASQEKETSGKPLVLYVNYHDRGYSCNQTSLIDGADYGDECSLMLWCRFLKQFLCKLEILVKFLLLTCSGELLLFFFQKGTMFGNR